MSGNDYDYSNLGSIPLTPQQNLYQPLALNIDPSMLEGSKYVYEADETKTRSIHETMFFGIGSSYILGLAVGSVGGVYEHLKASEGASKFTHLRKSLKPGTTLQNGLFNRVTKRGPFAANSMSVLALLYTASGGILGKVRNKTDVWNDIAGGAMTGFVFKSSAGRKMWAGATVAGAVFGLSLNMLIGCNSEGLSYIPDTIKDAVGYETD